MAVQLQRERQAQHESARSGLKDTRLRNNLNFKVATATTQCGAVIVIVRVHAREKTSPATLRLLQTECPQCVFTGAASVGILCTLCYPTWCPAAQHPMSCAAVLRSHL